MSGQTRTRDLAVIIAAYNAERTIGNAVKSAVDAGAVRVIVVDDGSQDLTADRAKLAGATVIRQENAGASAARARGAADLETEFAIFLDADDSLVPAGVARSLEMLASAPNASAAGGRVVGFAGNDEGKLLPATFSDVTVDTLLTKGFSAWPPAAAVIRVTKLREADGLRPAALKPRFAEDFEMFIRLARAGEILRHDEVSMRYEMSGGKSVRSAQEALSCKEQIREHYATSWGIRIQLMPAWRRRAAANKRIARANQQAGRPIAAAARLSLAYTQGAASLIAKPRSAGPPPLEIPTEVFEWAAGQDDNIGDSLLRRPSLADGRARGARLHVFHGPSTSTFNTGLGLESSDVMYRSFRPWIVAAAKRGLRYPTLLIPNAGEVKVSRRGALRLGALWAVSHLPHVRVVWMGAGVPGERSIWSLPYQLLARRAGFVSFRDAESVALLGSGRTTPDWAFALGGSASDWQPATSRHRLSFVLRGDRKQPSDAWVAWASRLAKRTGLTPTFVAQVRRDNALAERLAALMGGEVISFRETQTHAQHENDVRALYRETRLAVGDRLHGLIVAATEGAVPLGWIESSSGKIGRHFNAVDMPVVGRYEGKPADQLPDVTSTNLDVWTASLPTRIEQARDRIRDAQSAADEVCPRCSGE